MSSFELLIDFHLSGKRQGPGSDDVTLRAFASAGLSMEQPLEILDIGCGTGASTLCLAENTSAHITAVDLFPKFLGKLSTVKSARRLTDHVDLVCADMKQLPFTNIKFDVIWSEGAAYNIGFENAVRYWRRFLSPGGKLIVSEITWLTESRPEAIQQHWDAEYPEIATAHHKQRVLEAEGYKVLDCFQLGEECWRKNYYEPQKARFYAFLAKHGHSDEAEKFVEAEKHEMELYDEYSEYFGYCFYIAEARRD